MSIRVGFVFDPAGINPAVYEAETALLELKIIGLSDVEIVRIDENMMKMRKESLDLLIIDYGGLSMMGSTASGQINIWHACHYAEEHPGCLVVIWTTFTSRLYEAEMQEEFGHLDNIVVRYPNDDKWGKRFPARLQTWFNITDCKRKKN